GRGPAGGGAGDGPGGRGNRRRRARTPPRRRAWSAAEGSTAPPGNRRRRPPRRARPSPPTAAFERQRTNCVGPAFANSAACCTLTRIVAQEIRRKSRWSLVAVRRAVQVCASACGRSDTGGRVPLGGEFDEGVGGGERGLNAGPACTRASREFDNPKQRNGQRGQKKGRGIERQPRR